MQICTVLTFAAEQSQTTRLSHPKMDTKTQLLELIRELGEATVLATQLAKNLDWLAGLGHDINKMPEPEELTAAAVDLRCKIDKANFNVINNAPKY